MNTKFNLRSSTVFNKLIPSNNLQGLDGLENIRNITNPSEAEIKLIADIFTHGSNMIIEQILTSSTKFADYGQILEKLSIYAGKLDANNPLRHEIETLRALVDARRLADKIITFTTKLYSVLVHDNREVREKAIKISDSCKEVAKNHIFKAQFKMLSDEINTIASNIEILKSYELPQVFNNFEPNIDNRVVNLRNVFTFFNDLKENKTNAAIEQLKVVLQSLISQNVVRLTYNTDINIRKLEEQKVLGRYNDILIFFGHVLSQKNISQEILNEVKLHANICKKMPIHLAALINNINDDRIQHLMDQYKKIILLYTHKNIEAGYKDAVDDYINEVYSIGNSITSIDKEFLDRFIKNLEDSFTDEYFKSQIELLKICFNLSLIATEAKACNSHQNATELADVLNKYIETIYQACQGIKTATQLLFLKKHYEKHIKVHFSKFLAATKLKHQNLEVILDIATIFSDPNKPSETKIKEIYPYFGIMSSKLEYDCILRFCRELFESAHNNIDIQGFECRIVKLLITAHNKNLSQIINTVGQAAVPSYKKDGDKTDYATITEEFYKELKSLDENSPEFKMLLKIYNRLLDRAILFPVDDNFKKLCEYSVKESLIEAKQKLGIRHNQSLKSIKNILEITKKCLEDLEKLPDYSSEGNIQAEAVPILLDTQGLIAKNKLFYEGLKPIQLNNVLDGFLKLEEPIQAKFADVINILKKQTSNQPLNPADTITCGDLDGSVARLVLFAMAGGYIVPNSGITELLIDLVKAEYAELVARDNDKTTDYSSNKIINDKIVEMVKFLIFNDSPNESPINKLTYIGDDLFDRLSCNNYAMFYLLAKLKELGAKDNKSHLIWGNHDFNPKSEFMGIISDQDVSSQAAEVDGRYMVEPALELNWKALIEHGFENCYFDEQNSCFFIHHGFSDSMSVDLFKKFVNSTKSLSKNISAANYNEITHAYGSTIFNTMKTLNKPDGKYTKEDFKQSILFTAYTFLNVDNNLTIEALVKKINSSPKIDGLSIYTDFRPLEAAVKDVGIQEQLFKLGIRQIACGHSFIKKESSIGKITVHHLNSRGSNRTYLPVAIVVTKPDPVQD